ncbi:transposase [Mycobacterium innocens]|uniref:transposase n=1 Tax=Mycobacterium innocens TaxID=2341083 RepID=UPI000A4A4514|nr:MULTISPECIES: transposase [Mycobacterium]
MGRRGPQHRNLGRFFDQLGTQRCALLTHVSCDAAEWIHAVVRARAPQAVICLDAFHVVSWALKALDKVRARTMTRARIHDRHAMWATPRTPADVTGEQRTSLAEIAVTNQALYWAYLLKEQLREVFRVKGRAGRQPAGGMVVVGVALAHPRVRRAGPEFPDCGPNRVRSGKDVEKVAQKYTKYKPEFRDEVAKLIVESNRSIAEVAREYGLNETTGGGWAKKYRAEHAADEPPLELSERARLRELERRTTGHRAPEFTPRGIKGAKTAVRKPRGSPSRWPAASAATAI